MPTPRIPRTPSNVIQALPSPVVSEAYVPEPVVRGATPPVVSGIKPPVVRVPDTEIEYPTIDLPTEQNFQGDMNSGQNQPQAPNTNTRDLKSTPSVNVGGMDIPLPEPGPLVAAGSLAVITTVVTLGSTIALNQVKGLAEPFLREMMKGKKKKIKIKQVKPVLHFIETEDKRVEIIEYSQSGMKIIEGNLENLEQYLRDQIDTDSLWEFDNKIIIDEALKDKLTKEGQKRFKRYFINPKVIAKKLGAKFAF